MDSVAESRMGSIMSAIQRTTAEPDEHDENEAKHDRSKFPLAHQTGWKPGNDTVSRCDNRPPCLLMDRKPCRSRRAGTPATTFHAVSHTRSYAAGGERYPLP